MVNLLHPGIVILSGLFAVTGCNRGEVFGDPGSYVGRCVVPAFSGETMGCYEVRDSAISNDAAIAACADLFGSGGAGTWTAVDADADKYFDGCPRPDLFGDTTLRLYGRCDGFIYQQRDSESAFYAHAYYYGPFEESGNSQEWGCEYFDGATYYPAMEMPGDQVSQDP